MIMCMGVYMIRDLKKQGYGFEHNHGHGERHLATVFAMLTMLAFPDRPGAAALLRVVPGRAEEGRPREVLLGAASEPVPRVHRPRLGDALPGHRVRVRPGGAGTPRHLLTPDHRGRAMRRVGSSAKQRGETANPAPAGGQPSSPSS